jgi:hypothetical protein
MKMFLMTIAMFGLLTVAHADVMPSPSPAVAVAQPSAVAPVPAKLEPTVPVAEPAAPPQWAQSLIVSAQKLPVVGPIVSKAIVYIGILVPVLTALIGAIMAILSALSGIASLSGLLAFGEKVKAFQNGKIMYWLKYLSMFNAQKPETKSDEIQPLAKAA